MKQTCPTCEHILNNDDEIVATVVAYYHTIESSRTYSISKPTECLDIRHRNCAHPKGDQDGD